MDAGVIFHGTAPLVSFQQFSARVPRSSGDSVAATALQQEYESYNAEYTKALLHTMVARSPNLTFYQARSHFDLLRAQGNLEFLGMKSQYRSLVPPSQTGPPAVQPSGNTVPARVGSSIAQATTAGLQSANAATGISSHDVVARVGSQDQSTTTTPTGTASSKSPQHGAPKGHDTRSRSVGGLSAPESFSVEASSNRRHSADRELVPRSPKDDELAQRYRYTAEATSMFQPPPKRLSPTAPEFVPRTPHAGLTNTPGTDAPTSGSSSTTEKRPRPKRKDSWEDDEYLVGLGWDSACW
ncbi:hypothetical protein MMC27_006733 [Xylographa pallens]|nr:hypothetical protein [Xylographa pallens]